MTPTPETELMGCPFCGGKAGELFRGGDGVTVRLYRPASSYGCSRCQLALPSKAAWNCRDTRIASTRPADDGLACRACDGTGDVHRIDGEWLGICPCPAGDHLRQPAPRPDSALRDELAADFELFRRGPDFGAVRLASTMLLHSGAILEALTSEPQPRADSAVTANTERMGEALFSLSDRLRATDFIHSDSDPIKDANAAAYERVVLAWRKLTAALRTPAPRADDALRDLLKQAWAFASRGEGWPSSFYPQVRAALASEKPTDAAKGD